MKAIYDNRDVTNLIQSKKLSEYFDGDPGNILEIYVPNGEHSQYLINISDNFEVLSIKNISRIRLVDIILFCNELDILKLRLSEHDSVVDTFVIVESRKTFTGKEKDLYYASHQNEFQQWQSKIIYLVIDEFPETAVTPWDYEAHTRNFASKILPDICNEHTMVLLSDVDEIIDNNILSACKAEFPVEPRSLHLHMYYYNCNWKVDEHWHFPFITRYEVLRTRYGSLLTTMRQCAPYFFVPVYNAGWHLSYFLTYEDIAYKLGAFSHTEYDTEEFKSIEHIKSAVESGVDLFKRSGIVLKHTSNLNPNDKLPRNVGILPAMFQRVEC